MKHSIVVGLVACGMCGLAFAQVPTTQPLAPANLLTFQLDNVAPREAYEKLAAEAHLKLDPFSQQSFRGRDGMRISAAFDHATFWDAFAELARQTSTVPMGWDNGIIFLGQDGGTWLRQPNTIVGPLRVSAQLGISRHALLISRTPTRQNSAFVILHIDSEPNSPVVYISDFKVDLATDDQGKAIATGFPPPHPDVQLLFRGRAAIDIKVGEPTDDIKSIGTLKASFNAGVAKFQTIEIPKIREANKLAREAGDLALTFSYGKQGGGFTIDLHAEPKADDAEAWKILAPAIANSGGRVFDSGGKLIQNNGTGTGMSASSVTRKLVFHSQRAGADPPEKLIWEVPISVQLVPVTVEFKDLSLQ